MNNRFYKFLVFLLLYLVGLYLLLIIALYPHLAIMALGTYLIIIIIIYLILLYTFLLKYYKRKKVSTFFFFRVIVHISLIMTFFTFIGLLITILTLPSSGSFGGLVILGILIPYGLLIILNILPGFLLSKIIKKELSSDGELKLQNNTIIISILSFILFCLCFYIIDMIIYLI